MKSKLDTIINNLFDEIEEAEKTASTANAKKTALGESLIKVAKMLRVKSVEAPVSYDELEKVLARWDS